MLSLILLHAVLEVYRITLLSNNVSTEAFTTDVLEVYRITLLSNYMSCLICISRVLEVYRITLLSNMSVTKDK